MAVLRAVAGGHAFLQNLRRSHYEIATEESAGRRLIAAFADLAWAI